MAKVVHVNRPRRENTGVKKEAAFTQVAEVRMPRGENHSVPRSEELTKLGLGFSLSRSRIPRHFRRMSRLLGLKQFTEALQ